MKRSKFTEAQIAFALRQSETGTRVEEICREMGVSQATFFNWKKKYGGPGVPELRKLRQLEEENAQLKKLVADLSLDKQMLQDVIKKSCETGFTDNHKRVYRIYKACGLNLRTKRPKRSRSAAHRLDRLQTTVINRVWSMDFLQDALFNGERFRILAIVDNCSKICHGLLVGKSLKGADVVNELTKACLVEGCFPERIQCDNGSEFISKDVDRWAYENQVTLDFSRPGKPTDNHMLSLSMANSETNVCQ